MEPRAASASDLVFDDDFRRKLARLELLARKLFRGLLRGEHTASRRGRGLEFHDFRGYRPGDDFRHIDWNIYARLDQLFLKLHTSDEDLTLHLIVDASASMGFGEPSKFDQARRLAAALGCIALNNFDRVGVNAFSDGLGPSLAASKARAHLASLLKFLGNLACGGVTGLGPSLRAFAARIRTAGVVILISDLLGAEDAQDGIEALLSAGHDIVLIQLLAEAEIDPVFDGALRMADAETGDEVEVTVDEGLRSAYKQRLERRLREVEAYCRRQGVEYVRASTAVAFEDVVLKCLRQGAHLK